MHCQELDENRDSITANAIKTPHRHFSHNIRPQVVAEAALRFSSGFATDLSTAPVGGPGVVSPVDAEDAADEDKVDDDVALR